MYRICFPLLTISSRISRIKYLLFELAKHLNIYIFDVICLCFYELDRLVINKISPNLVSLQFIFSWAFPT